MTTSGGRPRVVFSTGPVATGDSRTQRAADEPVPERIVAKLRIEKKGRGGKTVTVVAELPRNPTFLVDLARDLKRACGTGGTVGEDWIELQGDRRERVRDILRARRFVVKG